MPLDVNVALDRLNHEHKSLTEQLAAIEQKRAVLAKHAETLSPLMKILQEYGRQHGGRTALVIPEGADTKQAAEIVLTDRGRPITYGALRDTLVKRGITTANLTNILQELAAEGKIVQPTKEVWLAKNSNGQAKVDRVIDRAGRVTDPVRLHDRLLAFLPTTKETAIPMDLIVETVLKTDWRSSSKNPRNVVYQNMVHLEEQHRVKRTTTGPGALWWKTGK